MSLKIIKTPCIGICSTGLGDDVCRGCKRYKHEVIAWNACSFDQKLSIESRLGKLLTTVVDYRIEIVDEALLKQQLALQPLDLAAHRSIHCHIYELIKAGASQIDEPSQYGIAIRPAFAHLSLRQIYDEMDSEFYHLSNAHYERYFAQYNR